MELPSVAVVVPTTLRPSVASAVASVRAQTYAGQVQVVVVVDGPDDHGVDLPVLQAGDRCVHTGARRGAGHARNVGVAATSSDLVAFLDDDDEWLPSKLEQQVALLQAASDSGDAVVVGGRVAQVTAGATAGRVTPHRLIAPSDAVEDYLFRHRAARSDRPSMHTSTLLMSAATARLVRWGADLPRHQDWDWLVRAQRVHGVRLVHHPAVTVRYAVGSRNSISARANWRDSLSWALTWRSAWAPQTYVDFVCAQPLRYAVQQRSGRGVVRCLAQIAATRRVPALGPTLYAVSGLLPRPVVERVVIARPPANVFRRLLPVGWPPRASAGRR